MAEPVVLVVDDEPGIIRLCQRLLDKAGFQVHSTQVPDEAISLLEKEPVNILLVDIRMPGMDGFQLMDFTRQRQPDLAVVVMTGYGTVETAIEALRRGADGLVLKPFSGAELVESVRHALEESQHKQDVLRLQTLRPLFQLSMALFTETDPVRLQELLVEMVCGSLGCSAAGVYRLEAGSNRYCLVVGRGGVEAEESIDPDRNLLGRVNRLGTAILANRSGPGDLSTQSYLIARDLGSAVCAPIAVKDARLILLAGRKTGEPALRESDLEFFAILARQAAVALENAALHSDLHAYIRQVEESQRALIQAEKMAIAGRLTASIAHEINNPLQSVGNCLHLAGRKELPPGDRQAYLDLAQSELNRLMATVQRMLEYYRPSALDRRPVDINDLIQHVVSLAGKQLQDRGIQVQARLSSRLAPILVVGDQIQQVLLNLILNAMEAMPEGGKISIETALRKKNLEILIEDTGSGIPQDQREQIFEPFVSTKVDGTGLGLAVSYGIISAHGGNLELVEGRGAGACFRISLPIGAVT